jgi:gas vesicle protein
MTTNVNGNLFQNTFKFIAIGAGLGAAVGLATGVIVKKRPKKSKHFKHDKSESTTSNDKKEDSPKSHSKLTLNNQEMLETTTFAKRMFNKTVNIKYFKNVEILLVKLANYHPIVPEQIEKLVETVDRLLGLVILVKQKQAKITYGQKATMYQQQIANIIKGMDSKLQISKDYEDDTNLLLDAIKVLVHNLNLDLTQAIQDKTLKS